MKKAEKGRIIILYVQNKIRGGIITMNQKLWTKLLATMLVMTLTLTNFILLGVYASNSYGATDNLERQETVTNNENVTFDAYFKDNKGNAIHSIKENMNKEDLKLFVAVGVKKGYLKNASLQVLGENETNSNLKLRNSNEDLEYIEKIEEQTNTIHLKQINSGTQVVIEIPVVSEKSETYDLSNFSKLNDVVIKGNYIGDAGAEIKIEKSIQVRNEWLGEATSILEQQLLRFIPYQVNEKSGTILQTLVKSGIQNNTLPVEETNVVIEVPVINGKKPSEVMVNANGILATNGKTMINPEEWNYNKETGIVTIVMKNEPTQNQVSWLKQGQDEMIVTYLYDEKVDTVETKQKVTVNVKAYNSVETNISANQELTISQNEVLGQIVSGVVEATEALSKGYLYNRAKKETNYNQTVTLDVSYPELVDELTLTQDMDYFVNEAGEMSPTTIGTTNYAYYKTTKIEEANFKTILGEEGSIRIETLAGEEIITLNKETKPDENGNYVVNYEKEVNQIRMITSKPIKAGKLVVRHEKALKGSTDYSKAQLESFKTLKAVANIEANAITMKEQEIAKNEQVATQKIAISSATVEKNTVFVEPTTKIETSVTNPNLSTIVKNENVELRVVLKTNDITCDLYKNPKIEIVLPSYIEKIDIKDINLLFDNELTVKNHKTYVNENGNTVIYVEIEGEQTAYSSDEISKGANLIINTDITLKQLTPTKEDIMGVYVINELATSYEQTNQTRERKEEQKGYTQTSLKAVAPVGMVTTNAISGFNAKNETVTSISSNEQTGKLDVKKEARTANVTMNVINNYPNVVNQVNILGRVPTKGSKNVDTLEDFNSNLILTMAGTMNVSGIDASLVEIYYSDNIDATKDLSATSNGWTKTPENLANVKSYLIVVNTDIATGTNISISYPLAIPENISYNMGAYSNYVVSFNNVTTEGNIQEKAVAAKVGLTTGEGPELEVTIHSDVEGKEVQEGSIITYTVTVKNIGKSEVKNVNVLGTIPGNTVYTYVQRTEGEGETEVRMYDNQLETYTQAIEVIEVGQTKTVTYQVKTGDLTLQYDENGNVQGVKEYTIQSNAKVAVEGYDAEFTSQTLNNKLVQGYINISMKTAPIPAEYVRAEGDEITYVIYVENINTQVKENITLKTTLPQGVTYKESTNSGTYDEQTRNLIWNIETLEGKASKIYQFTVTVDQLEANQYEKVLKAKASIVGAKEVESGDVSVTVQKAGLTVVQSSETKSTIAQGDTVIYHFEIRNNGKGDATTVKLTDSIPEELRYEIAQYSYNGKTYTSKLGTGNNVRVTIPRVKPGETINISLTAIVKELEGDQKQKQITNKATLTADGIDAIISNEITHTIVATPNSGSDDPSIDQVEKGTYRISGTIWLDANQNGSRDEDEQRMSGIPVILINAENGQIVQDITTKREKKQETGANGDYMFANLKPGKYMVVFLYDSGNYGLTTYKKEGINDDKNSDGIQMNIIYEGTNRVGAVSDKLELSATNIGNIDLGLVTSPKFDLKLDKVISKITVSDAKGTDVYDYKDTKLAKLDLNSKTANGSMIMIEYKLKVTNEGGVAGYAKKIVDYLPSDMKFSSELNKEWYTGDKGENLYNASLANTLIRPGETKEITLLLTKKINNSNLGIINNTAEIAESYNDLGLEDIDSKPANKVQNEDDYSSADAIIGIKTGEVYMYILLTITTITLLGVGIYFINKKVLKKQ